MSVGNILQNKVHNAAFLNNMALKTAMSTLYCALRRMVLPSFIGDILEARSIERRRRRLRHERRITVPDGWVRDNQKTAIMEALRLRFRQAMMIFWFFFFLFLTSTTTTIRW